MGRRPDVLIATYFDRGSKLQDSSNRYSFTCKGCSTIFPKGRTSHLLDHLTGKDRCLALTQHDLASILAIQASRSAERAQQVPSKRSYSSLNQDVPNGESPSKRQANASNTSHNGLSGLAALAEASRRIEMPSEDHANTHRSFSFSYQSLLDPVLDPFTSFTEGQTTADTSDMAISSSNPERSAPPSRGHSTGDDTTSQAFDSLQTPPPEDLTDQLTKAASYGVLIAAGPQREIVFEGQPTSIVKPVKARAKFTEARREEVRSVRSRRACIRCRMLRKPCSAEGDPCTRCSSVKNPRIWSSHCIRGRLADICDLWVAKFNTAAINTNVVTIKQETNVSEVTGYLTIVRSTDSPLSAKIAATMLVADDSHQIIIPSEHSQGESLKLRSALLDVDTCNFPVEVQNAIAYGRSLQANSEGQLFLQAASVYCCTHMLVFPAPDFQLSFDSNKVTQPAIGKTKVPQQSLDLAFKSAIEHLAQQECHRFLKDLEQVLINHKLPASAVLISSLMLFFSLDLLEYHFSTRQDRDLVPQAGNAATMIDDIPDWTAKLQTFSRIMQDLLRCRHIIEPLQVNATTEVVEVATTSTDSAAKALFQRLNIHNCLLQNGGNSCIAENPASVYFKHVANMLLYAQSNELLS